MKYIKSACLVAFCVAVVACVQPPKGEFVEKQNEEFVKKQEDTNGFRYALQDEIEEQEAIVLEDLTTRMLAYCYSSEDFSAEECARELEKSSFVRLTDIPRVTANRDFLTTGTYPTRRWREGDVVPRW